MLVVDYGIRFRMDKVSAILCYSNLSAKGLQNFAKKSQVIIIRAIVKSLGSQELHMEASENISCTLVYKPLTKQFLSWI